MLDIQHLLCFALGMSKTSEFKGTEGACLERVQVRQIAPEELPAWNALVDEKHYLVSVSKMVCFAG